MVVVSKRSALLVLSSLVLLSFAVRYPLVEHERFQTDSYFIHMLSESILDDGYAKWVLHPLSFFGYYPFSYASGVPFILAELSALTGLNVELCILISNMFFAMVFCLVVFLLVRQFISKVEYVLLATFFGIMGARFVDTSYWDASARVPLVVFAVLAVFCSLRAGCMNQNRLIVFAVIFGAISFATHHMAVLLVLFGFAYVMAAFEAKYLIPRIKLRKKQAAVVFNASIVIPVLVVSFAFLGLYGELTGSDDESLFSGVEPEALSVFLSLAASYTIQIGSILVVAVIGVLQVFRSSRLSTPVLFLVALFVAFIPLLSNSLYVSMMLTPFVAMMALYWISRLHRNGRRKSVVIVLLALLVSSSILLPLWSSDRWNSTKYVGGDTVEVENQLFSDANYVRAQYPNVYGICNNNVLSLQLHANTDVTFLGSGVYLALSGDVDPEEVARNLTWSNARFPTNFYIWFEYPPEPRVDVYVLALMTNGMAFVKSAYSNSQATTYYSTHPKVLVIVDNNWPSNTITQYNVLSGALMDQLRNAAWLESGSHHPAAPIPSYMTYQSEGVTLYSLQLL